MKTIKQSIFYSVLILALVFTSCKKDDDGGGGGDAASGTIKASVEGSGNFTSNSSFTSGSVATSGGVSTLTMVGSTNDGSRNISIIVNGFSGNGSYDIGGDSSVFVVGSYTEVNISNPSDSKFWTAPFDDSVSGEVNFTESSDTKVKGTFNFNGKNNEDGTFKNVTNGSFNIDL